MRLGESGIGVVGDARTISQSVIPSERSESKDLHLPSLWRTPTTRMTLRRVHPGRYSTRHHRRSTRVLGRDSMAAWRHHSTRRLLQLLAALVALGGATRPADAQGYPFSQRGSVTQHVAHTTIAIEHGLPVPPRRALLWHLV